LQPPNETGTGICECIDLIEPLDEAAITGSLNSARMRPMFT
jgi:hypothetical protein